MIKNIVYLKSLIVGFSLVLFFVSSTTTDQSMVRVPGGILHTEDPITKVPKTVSLKPFFIDKHLVTVGDFEHFVRATNYKTEAEIFGNAGVFDSKAKGWALVEGADFRFPRGRSKPKAESNHPVTQVSWNDAKAYATWKGKRLPTQWEWEYAAKNASSTEQIYSWGDDLVMNGKYKANTWQGSFPSLNTIDDGFEYTSPVGYYGANTLGLTDMGGNVWQWCDDWISPSPHEAQIDPSLRKVTRGGSFLCDPMVCHGYTVHGRSASTPESSMVHIGFRCAKDI